MRKVLSMTIFIFIAAFTNSFAVTEISQQCSELGFKEGTPEIANCKLELLLLKKQTKLEEKKLRAAEAQVQASKQQAIAAEATANATQSIANSQAWRNNRTLMKQGQRMLSGACTLGIDC
jgi:hypothetical protein